MRSLREKFDDRWIPEPNTGCWLWMGTVSTTTTGVARKGRHGYARYNGKFAHRIAWELYREPISVGMVVDHTCRVRICVNPDHLRVVTQRENALENSTGPSALHARKTHCSKCGGPYVIFPCKPKARNCRPCRAENERRNRPLRPHRKRKSKLGADSTLTR